MKRIIGYLVNIFLTLFILIIGGGFTIVGNYCNQTQITNYSFQSGDESCKSCVSHEKSSCCEHKKLGGDYNLKESECCLNQGVFIHLEVLNDKFSSNEKEISRVIDFIFLQRNSIIGNDFFFQVFDYKAEPPPLKLISNIIDNICCFKL